MWVVVLCNLTSHTSIQIEYLIKKNCKSSNVEAKMSEHSKQELERKDSL